MRWTFKIMLFIYCFSVMRNAIVSIVFQANKEAIVAEFCVQKDYVKNTCQGQCHLRESLEAMNDEESDDGKSRPFNFQAEENIIPQTTFALNHSFVGTEAILFPFFKEGTLSFSQEFNPPPPKV